MSNTRRLVRFKLNQEQSQAVLAFAAVLGMPVDEAAKRSLFWAIREAYKRRDGEGESNDEGTAAHSEGTSTSLPVEESSTSDSLASETINVDPSSGSDSSNG